MADHNPSCTPSAPHVEAAPISPASCTDGSTPNGDERRCLNPPNADDSPFVAGQQLAIVVSSGSSRQLVEHVKRRFEALGANAELVVPAHSDRVFDDRTEIEATHTLEEKPSTEFDFVAVLPGLDTPSPLSDEITQWAHPFRDQSKPIAIGAQAAERMGVDIDNACVFDVSACDAFVQACKSDSEARAAARAR